MLVLPLMAQLEAHDGSRFAAAVHGREREDGLWEGWLEFSSTGKHVVLRTERETTQSTYDGLAYWASGLEPAYVEGAFERAQANVSQVADAAPPESG